MAISASSRLGPYEVLSPLGAGGMGEVYRAKDPRLGREVAIKVLPASYTQDPDRLRRFEQEAKAAGALSHANITAVFDIGEYEGAPYVVSELLEGETLGTALAGGLLPVRQAVDYGIQIAHGLSAAHEKGIVHRDLKPENLFVCRDGRVKILDFGLARVSRPETTESQVSRASTLMPGTEPGVVLGTVGYMSPEQVRGQEADSRSDIFSLGVVLYEMLSGRRAFARDSAVETMNAILTDDPPEIASAGRPIAVAIERIVRRCLEKRPEQRFRSAGDLAFALEAVSGSAASAVQAVPTERSWSARRSGVGLALVASLAAGVGLGFWGARHWAPSSRPASFRPLTFRRGSVNNARFGPDGRTVYYSATWEGQRAEVFSTSTENPGMRLLGLPPAGVAAVSSTGELAIRIGARGVTAGTLARVSPEGGAPREILDDATSADWSPDGKSLAVLRGKPGSMRVEFPVGKRLCEAAGPADSLRVSPRGDFVAFIERKRAGLESGFVRVVDLSGKVRNLTTEWLLTPGLAWSPDGKEVFFVASEAGGDATGESSALRAVSLSGRQRVIGQIPGGLQLHDISRDGRFLINTGSFRRGIAGLAPGETKERDLSWLDGSQPADLSSDGRTLLFDEIGSILGGSAVYLRGTDGSPAVRLGDGRALALSPDGKTALSMSHGSGLVLLPTGAGEPRPLPAGAIASVESARWFPDGKRFLLEAKEPERPFRLFLGDASAGKLRGVGLPLMGFPAISPDGGSFAFINAGEDALSLTGPEGGPVRLVPGAAFRETPAGWSADGRSLFVYRYGGVPVKVFQVDVASGKRALWREIGPADSAGIRNIFPIFVAADGQAYVYGYTRTLSSLYVVSGWR